MEQKSLKWMCLYTNLGSTLDEWDKDALVRDMWLLR